MIKVGILGCGNMGRNHIRVLSGLTNLYEVVGVYDMDEENCKRAKETFDVKIYHSLEDLVDHAQALVIATPTATHFEYGKRCIECEKDVFMEKPLASNSEEAKVLAELADEKNSIFMVGHIETYNPVTNELKKIIKKEEVISLDFHRLSPFDKRVANTDVVLDLMIHDIYNLQYLVEENVKSIKSTGVKVYSEKYDYVQTLIEFQSGKLASLTASRVTEAKERNLKINTKGAFISVDYINRSIDISRKTKYKLDLGYHMDYVQENIVEKVHVPMKEPLVAELEHFATSVKNHEKPMSGGAEGCEALILCENIISDIK